MWAFGARMGIGGWGGEIGSGDIYDKLSFRIRVDGGRGLRESLAGGMEVGSAVR